MSDLRYWIISVPAKSGNKEAVFSRIQRCSAEFIENGTASRFLVPGGLRVGTLDSLMSMSDELVKIDHMVEHTARKIGQQIYSLKDKKPESGSIFLTINGSMFLFLFYLYLPVNVITYFLIFIFIFIFFLNLFH